MSFEKFFESVYDKNIQIYVCDGEEDLECIIAMKVFDYTGHSRNKVELLGEDGSMVILPVTGEFKADEEGFRCDTKNKIYLFSII